MTRQCTFCNEEFLIRDEDLAFTILEHEAEALASATLEETVAELADTLPAVNVGPAECLDQLAESQQTLQERRLARRSERRRNG